MNIFIPCWFRREIQISWFWGIKHFALFLNRKDENGGRLSTRELIHFRIENLKNDVG